MYWLIVASGVLIGEEVQKESEDVRTIDLPGYACRWFRVCGGRWKLP
jgi:hypothetical protein